MSQSLNSSLPTPLPTQLHEDATPRRLEPGWDPAGTRLEHPEGWFLPQQQLSAVGHGGLANEGVGGDCVNIA